MKHSLKAVLVGLALCLGMAAAAPLHAQGRFTLSGTVYEKASGLPAPGAVVMVKGTGTGATADLDGKYSLPVKTGDVVICQFFGFVSQELTVGTSSKADFWLEEEAITLEQSVVVGYGTLKKTQLVGAVENLDGEALENRVNSSVARSLQGQVAGLNIYQSDSKPNHSGSIYIRGNSTTYHTRSSAASAEGTNYSIGTGSTALVLIDGVEGDISQVNSDDIATVAVLKDASSTAVYGARGAFGVILITTKNPTKDKITVNYSGSVSLNERTVKWEDGVEKDAYEWMSQFVEFQLGTGRTPSSPGTFPNNLANIMDMDESYMEELYRRSLTGYKNPVAVDANGNYTYYGNTDWLGMIYTKQHFTTVHSISVNAASKRVRTSISGRFFGQGSVYQIGEEKFRSFNLRAKTAIDVAKWLTVDNNTSFFRSYYKQPFSSESQPLISVIFNTWGAPVFVPSNPDGSHTRQAEGNGYWSFKDNHNYQENEYMTVSSTTGADIWFIKDVLKLRGDFTFKFKRDHQDRVKVPSQYSTAMGSYTDQVQQQNSYKSRARRNTDYWSANVVATWTPKLGENHDLNVVAGWNVENSHYNNYIVQRRGILDADLPSFELMDNEQFYSYNDADTDYSIMGVFGRVNYSLFRKYIFEVSARYDGSSKFPSKRQWGFFPSASVGWRLSEEPFMKWSRKWLDNFKFRANVGSAGNANIGAYRFLETISVSKATVLIDGSLPSYTVNPSVIPDELTWETVTTYDIGIDSDFLRSRLSFSGDYYVRNNDNMIITGPELPAIYGASAPAGNFGALQTKGWELSLSWRDAFILGGKEFSYSVKGSLWDSRTWVRRYNNLSGNIFTFYEGKEMGEIWGFRTAGIFASNEEANNWAIDDYHKNGDNFREYAGDLKFVDLNGDGRIGVGSATLNDHGDLDRIGNTTPRYQYGLNLDANWNGIGISVFFQGIGHRDWYPGCESGLFWGKYNRWYSQSLKSQNGDNYAHVDYSTPNWVVTNMDKNPYWTRRVGLAANRNLGPLTWENDHYLQNAAYLRLKNATISYTLPEKLTGRWNISKVRIYLTGENLFAWSPIYKHTSMFDPEGIESGDADFGGGASGSTGLYGVGDGFSYPMLRSYTVGINITF